MIPVSTATLVTRPAIRPKLDKGASAEVVAMATIGAADSYGLPVSTTGCCPRVSPAPCR